MASVNGGGRRVTLREVARAARVSPSTVSRALAGNPRISAATRARVQEAMERLGYHPNAIARSLVTRSSRTLGVVLYRPADQAFSHPFFAEALRGVARVAQAEGYSLLVTTADTYEAEAEQCLAMLRERRADGAVLLASRNPDPLIDELVRQRFPFVVLGRVDANLAVYWVNNDNVQAAALAVGYLAELGHRRIGLIGGRRELTVTQDRLEGFRLTLQELGLEVRAEWMQFGEFSWEEGYRSGRTLLQSHDRPTAIVAMDDVLAAGAMRAARELDLRVPEDVSVIGFNDDPMAQLLSPPLTTVRIPARELGEAAARQLIERLSGRLPPVRHVILPVQLVVRGSTGPAGR
ncbi:MAG: LacI family DNA-binding transcriptional regulator [Limnochordaceae bacterium]|nr:LacI family DNA-binding transcriptional regulator [Limnochordaceae bacterium]